MKKLIFIFGMMAPVTLMAQQKYHVEGRMRKWKGVDTVLLGRPNGMSVKYDTALAQNGRFHFDGELQQPEEVFLKKVTHIDEHTVADHMQIYLAEGSMQIEGKDSLLYAKTKNSPLTAQMVAFRNDIRPMSMRQMNLRNVAIAHAKELGKDAPKDSLSKVYEDQFKLLRDSILNKMTTFIRTNPTSFFALSTLKDMAGAQINYDLINPLYQNFTPELRETPTGKYLGERLAKAAMITVGVKAPEFTSTTLAGDSLDLYSVVKKSKLTLVDFWASWCGPCRAENPNVVKVYQQYHDKGFNIVSISLDDNKDKWKAAIDHDGMPWYHVSSLKGWKEPIAVRFGISAVPDNLLLDANGKIIARGLRGQALYDKIATLL
jgi:thiol-disulfide isomerase/thioredoxin